MPDLPEHLRRLVEEYHDRIWPRGAIERPYPRRNQSLLTDFALAVAKAERRRIVEWLREQARMSDPNLREGNRAVINSLADELEGEDALD